MRAMLAWREWEARAGEGRVRERREDRRPKLVFVVSAVLGLGCVTRLQDTIVAFNHRVGIMCLWPTVEIATSACTLDSRRKSVCLIRREAVALCLAQGGFL